MIGMGTTKITTGCEVVMSDFAVAVFGVMLAAGALFLTGGIVTFIVLLTRHYMGL
jgi:hypothetical protein